ncbi:MULTISPECIES: SAM-dependent methyltransferase [unclassified Roseitalea]|uniref:class I SAM-dependent methyltransferase n=1 Tax=unclassified Roseitalea TaxID=2639107 RepID=UPI00273EC695|nr:MULTISPECIES: SAM-dependent methyltransferase [unclassified Roseitalea]
MSDELREAIATRIGASGPMSLAEYMAECLLHPRHGYYARREPFGAGGDFVTAPEISQLFGEIVGAFMIHVWRQAGRPAPFALAEAGPGRGTLMADMLRTARLDPEFRAAARVVLIEASERLRGVQRARLGDDGADAQWVDTIAALPGLPTFLVANEFFDALPIRQFVNTAGGWRERMVGLDDRGALHFVAGPGGIDPALLPPGHGDAPEGAIFETSPAREAAAAELAAHIARHGGLALVFDYGHLQPGIGDTFQAVRDHAYADPLAAPGRADLTSHVDFAALARAARQAGAHVPAAMTQGAFLLASGMAERAGALGAGKSGPEQAAIVAAVERLCGEDEGGMGALFKVMGIAHPRLGRPIVPFELPA